MHDEVGYQPDCSSANVHQSYAVREVGLMSHILEGTAGVEVVLVRLF